MTDDVITSLSLTSCQAQVANRSSENEDKFSWEKAEQFKPNEKVGHYGRKQPRIQTEVVGHSLVRSLVRSHRSLVRLLRNARFARALPCALSFARLLTSRTPSLVGK